MITCVQARELATETLAEDVTAAEKLLALQWELRETLSGVTRACRAMYCADTMCADAA